MTAQADNTNNNSIDISCGDMNSTDEIIRRRRWRRRRIERLASESAVVVFSSSSCCLCHVAKRLLCSLGVSPTVHELDRCSSSSSSSSSTITASTHTTGDTYMCNNQHIIDAATDETEADDTCPVSIDALAEFLADRYHADAASPTVPAVFIGGKFLGGLDHLMAAHIAGTLVPLLKEAGALWL